MSSGITCLPINPLLIPSKLKTAGWTIEGLVVLDRTTLGIVNDNNYPLGQARDNSGAQPDNNEFILIEIDPLWD